MSAILRIARAPFTLLGLAIGGVLMFLFLAAISVAGWYEWALLGLRLKVPSSLPAALGILTFITIGVIIPAIGMYQVIGWIGLMLGPTIMILLISRLDHW